jgi:microtubule-associated protein-like 6
MLRTQVQDIKYSPDGNMLAAASRDNNIYFFNAQEEYQKIGVCKGHSSYVLFSYGVTGCTYSCSLWGQQVTHIDWSLDGSILRSTDGAYEILFWNTETRRQVVTL